MAKIKGKIWYDIKTPKFAGAKVIGQTLADEPKKILGRIMDASMMELFNDPKKYHIKLFFKIVNVEGETANTKFFGHTCTRDYIARIVRLRSGRIDTNQVFNLKDGKIRVKSICITNRQAVRSATKSIRKRIAEILKENIEGTTIEEFVNNFISEKIQKNVFRDIKKIYPVRTFQIRKSEIIE